MNKKGFTLIELLVVMAIIVALILLVLPSVLKAGEGSRKNVFANQLIDFAARVDREFKGKKAYDGASTPTCYKINQIKLGENYGGCIIMNYGEDKIDSVHIFNKTYIYDGDYATLIEQKGKAIAVVPNQEYDSESLRIEGPESTICPASCNTDIKKN